MRLSDENCTPPPEGARPMDDSDAVRLLKEVPGWAIKDSSIEREFKFRDFSGAMAFVNRVAGVAESQGHHPDILISYSRVRLTLSTHKAGGLTRNDFILASRINAIAD